MNGAALLESHDFGTRPCSSPASRNWLRIADTTMIAANAADGEPGSPPAPLGDLSASSRRSSPCAIARMRTSMNPYWISAPTAVDQR